MSVQKGAYVKFLKVFVITFLLSALLSLIASEWKRAPTYLPCSDNDVSAGMCAPLPEEIGGWPYTFAANAPKYSLYDGVPQAQYEQSLDEYNFNKQKTIFKNFVAYFLTLLAAYILYLGARKHIGKMSQNG